MAVRRFEVLKGMHDSGEVFYAARLLPLGLIAYGFTEEEAVKRLKEMSQSWIDARYDYWKKNEKEAPE